MNQDQLNRYVGLLENENARLLETIKRLEAALARLKEKSKATPAPGTGA